MQVIPPLWQKVKRNSKASWCRWKGEWKSWLKAQHSENEDHDIWFHHFMTDRWGNSGNSGYFSGLQNHGRWWLQPWNKKTFTPWKEVMTNLDSILKSRDITLPTKVHLVKAMVFPVIMYGCESWTTKSGERQGTDPFGVCYWKKHKLESGLPGEISITSDMQMTPPLWQKVKRN